MKNGIKTLVLWLILIVIVVGLVNAAWSQQNSKISYSELVTRIVAGEVSEITISANQTMVTATLRGSETAATSTSSITNTSASSTKKAAIPSVDALLELINDNIVTGDIKVMQEEESPVYAIISLLSPIIILVVFLLDLIN